MHGIFSWDRTERMSRRYGSFFLSDKSYNGEIAEVDFDADKLTDLIGKRVKIAAEVVDTRSSGHLGDSYLFSQGSTEHIKPTTPKIGEIQLVGIGIFYIDRSQVLPSIGVRPSDGRDTFWLDPKVMYRLHDQTVKLMIGECGEEDLPMTDLRDESQDGKGRVVAPGIVQITSRQPLGKLTVRPKMESLGDGAFSFQIPDPDKIGSDIDFINEPN